MDPVTVAAASVVARKVFDLLADDLARIITTKLRRDPAERAFESALAAAVRSFGQSGGDRRRLAEVLLGERGVLADDIVAAELAQIVRFDREPDPSVIAAQWRDRLSYSGADLSLEAVDLLERIRTELRGTDIFRPVFDSQSLDAIEAELSKLHDTIRPDERKVVRHLVNDLEDRRILYDPATGHPVAQHFVYAGLDRSDAPCLTPAAKGSIQDIRRRIGVAINELPESTPGIDLLKRMQATCRWAIDVAERPQIETVCSDPDNEENWGYGALAYGMTFLGLFRKKFGHDLRALTDTYGVGVDGPLRTILAMADLYDPRVLAQAEGLVKPYFQKHGGFTNMEEGWYERLCAELDTVRQPWSAE